LKRLRPSVSATVKTDSPSAATRSASRLDARHPELQIAAVARGRVAKGRNPSSFTASER